MGTQDRESNAREAVTLSCARASIPEDAFDFSTLLLPLAKVISEHSTRTTVVGISGSPGTGKTTFSVLLDDVLTHCFGASVCRLDIDDFYKPRGERLQYAPSNHELFSVRGVPGTHHVNDLLSLVQQLGRNSSQHGHLDVPIFDKSKDDRAGYRQIGTQFDVVLVAGWCLGAQPQPARELVVPINELEVTRDPHGVWRRQVNHELSQDYAKLTSLLDTIVYMKSPSFTQSIAWRQLQEAKLRAAEPRGDKTMSDSDVASFLSHYQRVVLSMEAGYSRFADHVVALDGDHRASLLRSA